MHKIYKNTYVMDNALQTLLACPISDIAEEADSWAWPIPDMYVATPLAARPLFASPTTINALI